MLLKFLGAVPRLPSRLRVGPLSGGLEGDAKMYTTASNSPLAGALEETFDPVGKKMREAVARKSIWFYILWQQGMR